MTVEDAPEQVSPVVEDEMGVAREYRGDAGRIVVARGVDGDAPLAQIGGRILAGRAGRTGQRDLGSRLGEQAHEDSRLRFDVEAHRDAQPAEDGAELSDGLAGEGHVRGGPVDSGRGRGRVGADGHGCSDQ